MTITIDPEASIGQLVAARPGRSRVFESLQIDYCCGGKLPLTEACAKRGLEPQDVIGLLEKSDSEANQDGSDGIDPGAMSLTELADHIEQVHHAYVRAELPRLDQMTDRVFRVHGEHEPRLAEIRRAFIALRDELTSHMFKEEQILFPAIRQLELEGSHSLGQCGSISNPIQQMEHEHENAGGALEILRRESDDFQPPEWACNTYRAMLDGLYEFEQDLHTHIHKENNVLFPRALELEQSNSATV